jgi:Flp pilus assembly protein TadD
MASKAALGVAIIALVTALGGCADRKLTTGSIGRGKPVDQMSNSEVQGATVKVGDAYARNPKDSAVAMRYASLLQAEGRSDQSLAVMRKLAIDYPRDRKVLAAYGKSLAAAEQFEPALDAIRRAQTPEYPDWKLYSAEAAILDQVGKSEEARAIYRKALDIQPDEPSVLSNLGMSYVLSGDLKTAETYLRTAIGRPHADSRVRQNLALVVGLQGRFEEAEQIATHELSPDQAQANVAYLRTMMAQQNAWSQLEKEDKAAKEEVSTN